MAAFDTTCRGYEQAPLEFVTLHQIEIVPTGPDPRKDPKFLAMHGSSRQPQRSQPAPTPVQQPQRPSTMGRGTQPHPDAGGQQFQPSPTSAGVINAGFHSSHGQPRTQPQPMAWLDPSAGGRRNGVPNTQGEGLGQFAIEQLMHQRRLAQEQLIHQRQLQLAQERLAQEQLAHGELGQLAHGELGQFAQEPLIHQRQLQLAQERLAHEQLIQRRLAQEQLGQEQFTLGQFAQEQLIQWQLAAQGQSI